LDPGLGFGKSVGDNLRLLNQMGLLVSLGRPVVVGASRKSFLGAILGGLPLDERLEASLTAGVMALMKGAAVLRVHDVKAAARSVKVFTAVQHSTFTEHR
jgi:dihydropteroate synthase